MINEQSIMFAWVNLKPLIKLNFDSSYHNVDECCSLCSTSHMCNMSNVKCLKMYNNHISSELKVGSVSLRNRLEIHVLLYSMERSEHPDSNEYLKSFDNKYINKYNLWKPWNCNKRSCVLEEGLCEEVADFHILAHSNWFLKLTPPLNVWLIAAMH